LLSKQLTVRASEPRMYRHC